MENEQWRELYGLLRSLSDAEARHALARIRDADDPITVLSFARRASILADPPVPLPGTGPTDWSPRMAALNLRTLSESPIRVHAWPWTAIAGDGLVSQLISSFFTWDDAFFYPFIDREAFLEDMRSGDVEQAEHCSPFLVNAICASRCMYRYAAYEMLRRLHRERTFEKIKDDPEQERLRQIISKALWGLFCSGSMMGNDDDMEQRRQLYATVCEWSRNLPQRMRYDRNLAPQTFFPKIYTDEVLISILRPLSPETLFDRGSSVKGLWIQYAGSDMAVMDKYAQSFPLHDCSCMTLCGLYNTFLTVVPHLGDPRTHAIFAKAALMLRRTARDSPMAKYIL
ncbi:hypothetical protein ACJZ2D_003869 [Fusarium nematophilum]